MLRSTHINKIKTILFTNDKYCKLSHFLPILKAFFASPKQVSAAVSPSSSFVNLGKGTKTKHILSSKQMAAKQEVWTERSKGFFKIWATAWIPSVPRSMVLHPPSQPPPLPEACLCSTAPSARLLSKLSAEVSGAHRSEGPGEGKAPAAPRAFGFFRAGLLEPEVQWCPRWYSGWIPSPPLPQLTPAEAQSRGGAPGLQNWNAKSLRPDGRAGRAPSWVAAALAPGGGARISLVQWLRQTGGRERCCPAAVGAEPGTQADPAAPSAPGNALSTLCALTGPSSLAGPY